MANVLIELGDVQIPILASMLLGGCAAKLGRTLQHWSIDAGLGPTALFPLRLRRPAAMAMCAIEFGFGVALILTAGPLGRDGAAGLTRLGTGLLFVVATCALIELRSVRPDVGCGCFGELSTAPITGRIIARSALLGVSALAIVRLPRLRLPQSAGQAGLLLLMFVAELTVIGMLSPEIRETLVRIGYSAPCELRVLAPEQILASLQRSAQWRRHGALIADQRPADTWRELCWRYFSFASRHGGRDVELVFAVYLQQHRPAVHSVMVDTMTGAIVPWPAEPAGPVGELWPRLLRGVPQLARLSGDSGRSVLGLSRTARLSRAGRPAGSALRQPGAPPVPGPVQMSGQTTFDMPSDNRHRDRSR
jgi:hypothetical protein